MCSPLQVILDLLGLSNKYDFAALQQAIMAYLKATLSTSNVCMVYNVVIFYQLKELCQACTVFMDMNAAQVMKSDGFFSLSKQALVEVLARDSFFAHETDIYQGIQRWMAHHEVLPGDTKELLGVVRLQLIPIPVLLQEVRQSGLFEPDSILDAITMMNKKKPIELSQRGLLGEWLV